MSGGVEQGHKAGQLPNLLIAGLAQESSVVFTETTVLTSFQLVVLGSMLFSVIV